MKDSTNLTRFEVAYGEPGVTESKALSHILLDGNAFDSLSPISLELVSLGPALVSGFNTI
jgi:hypothetical protein